MALSSNPNVAATNIRGIIELVPRVENLTIAGGSPQQQSSGAVLTRSTVADDVQQTTNAFEFDVRVGGTIGVGNYQINPIPVVDIFDLVASVRVDGRAAFPMRLSKEQFDLVGESPEVVQTGAWPFAGTGGTTWGDVTEIPCAMMYIDHVTDGIVKNQINPQRQQIGWTIEGSIVATAILFFFDYDDAGNLTNVRVVAFSNSVVVIEGHPRPLLAGGDLMAKRWIVLTADRSPLSANAIVGLTEWDGYVGAADEVIYTDPVDAGGDRVDSGPWKVGGSVTLAGGVYTYADPTTEPSLADRQRAQIQSAYIWWRMFGRTSHWAGLRAAADKFDPLDATDKWAYSIVGLMDLLINGDLRRVPHGRAEAGTDRPRRQHPSHAGADVVRRDGGECKCVPESVAVRQSDLITGQVYTDICYTRRCPTNSVDGFFGTMGL